MLSDSKTLLLMLQLSICLYIATPLRFTHPSARCLLVEEGVEMVSSTFSDSGMWVIGGGLLLVIVGAMVALGPMATARWF